MPPPLSENDIAPITITFVKNQGEGVEGIVSNPGINTVPSQTGRILDESGNTFNLANFFESLCASGYETGASNPSTDIHTATSPTFQIAVDSDVPAATYHSITLTPAGLTTGAAIAAAMQAAIRAIGGSYALVTVAFTGGVYVITSGMIGPGSKVRVANGASHDVAAALGIGSANGAVDTDGAISGGSFPVALTGSTVPDAQSLPTHIYDPTSGKTAGVDQYSNLKVIIGNAFSSLVDSITSILALGSPTAGTWTSGPGAPTTTTGGSFLIAMDADATNPITNWQLVTIGAAATGAAIATAMQTAIQNLADLYQTGTVAYTNGTYVFTSGSQGLGSQVMIMSAPSNDIAATLLLTAGTGATYVNGTVGTPVSLSNPLPVIGSMNGPQGVQDYTVALGDTLYINASADVAFGDLTINGTLANYGNLRCTSVTLGSGARFIKGAASTTEIGVV